MQEAKEEINILEDIKKVKPKHLSIVIILCLLLLCYYLGYIVGFNQAYGLQEDYYEKKIERFCFCSNMSGYTPPIAKIEGLDFNISLKEK